MSGAEHATADRAAFLASWNVAMQRRAGQPAWVQADVSARRERVPTLMSLARSGDPIAALRLVALANALDPPKLTRSREELDGALKKYLDMNRLALSVVAPGGLYLTCSCTGLVSEEAFLDMLRRQELLPLGLHTAEEFGFLVAALAQRGRTRSRVNDLWLAASAREHRLPILTCNPDDFADLPGVRTIGPETPPEAFA